MAGYGKAKAKSKKMGAGQGPFETPMQPSGVRGQLQNSNPFAGSMQMPPLGMAGRAAQRSVRTPPAEQAVPQRAPRVATKSKAPKRPAATARKGK